MEKTKNKVVNIKTVGGVFLILLVMLIFLSKTIYTYNQPTVTATTPVNGKLKKSETVSGMTQWADMNELYAEATGKIDEILVREGDRVGKGQELVRLSFNTDDIEQKMKEIGISRQRNILDIENINERIDKINRYIDELKNEVYKTDYVSDFDLKQVDADIRQNDLEITQAKNEISRLEKDYEDMEALYGIGGISLSELESVQRALQTGYDKLTTLLTKQQTLNDRRDNTQRGIDETKSKNSESVTKQEENRRKQLADYQADLSSCAQELKAKELDRESLDLQEEAQLRALEKCENGKVLYALEDSTVVSLPVSTGQRVNEGQLVVTCGVVGQYEVMCKVPPDNNFIMVGDTCKLENSSMYIEGIVTKITPTDQVKEITVFISADSQQNEEAVTEKGLPLRFGRQNFGDINDVTAGETFDVTFEKESFGSYTLVPNGTLNMDSDGYFLYQVKQRNGILGKEYYAEKLRVYIGDSDSDNTVITSGIMFFEPIVSLSDKGFSEGDVVKLKNEGDFFAQ